MGQGRPLSSSANYGAAHARIDLDLSALTSSASVARAAGDAAAKGIDQAFKVVQNEQKIALQQAQQTTAAVRAQQAQLTAITQAESAERKAAANAEATVIQQQAKAQTATIVEEQRRQTAAYKQELRERNRSQVNAGSFAQNAAGFVGAAVGGPIGGLVGAAATGNIGIAAGLAINQGVQFAVEASQTATAYNRQEIAARSLAGSQEKLNSLMAAYDRATGGAIDKSTALQKVTALEAVGFAKNASDLERFATGVRGAALAMGQTQDYITQETQLAIVNQSYRRLDQIGLGVGEVRQRVDELTKANKSLTQEQAFSQAVIGLQNEKFGDLAKSADGAATGLERLNKAWKDYQLQQGQNANSTVNQVAGGAATALEYYSSPDRNEAAHFGVTGPGRALSEDSLIDRFTAALRGQSVLQYNVAQAQMNGSFRFHDRGDQPNAGTLGTPSRFGDIQEDALLDWNKKRIAIEHETQAAVVAEARSWANQRLEAERSYTKQSIREAQDWATQQSRTIEDFQESQSKAAQNYAKQQARAERDLGRSIAQEQADEAEKVADIRKDSAKRIREIEEDYADQRAKAARDHSNKLLDAAGDLDAKAVYQEQRAYADQLQDAQKAHDKQVKDNRDQLQERLDDEAKSLDKSIRQQRTALAQREADQAEDYAQSNAEAQAQFTKEQARANEDRGIRIGRMAQDQADQLTAIDNAHSANMAAIAQRADDEKKAIQTVLTDAGIAVKGFVDVSVDDSIKAYDKFFGHVTDLANGKIRPGQDSAGIPATRASPAGYATGGWVRRSGWAQVHAGEYVLPVAQAQAIGSGSHSSRSIVFEPGSVVVHAAAGHNEEQVAYLVIDMINKGMEARAA